MRNSYCNKCKIELSHTELVCPLCGSRTAVESDNYFGAYPACVQAVPLNSKHTALKALIVLLFPALCCFAINILVSGHVSWGPYIWGAEACFFVFAFLPKLFNRPKVSLCILADTAATVAYLYIIGVKNGSTEWILPLGLPLALLAGLLIYSILKTIQMRKPTQLFKTAAVICILGIFSLAVQIAISVFQQGVVTIGWALPVILPTMVISSVLFYVEFNSQLKRRLLRAVFL
ncbi:MAG: hypothetical protein KBI01_01870 [Oscillospiraceae bacterium]|nr:hypothetical protein [Oscillospiraceae bacterium]